MSKWIELVSEAPPDRMFGLSASFRADPAPSKVDLGVGAYRNHLGQSWVLPSVQVAKKQLYEDPGLGHEYLPISGLQSFVDASQRLVLGSESNALKEQRVASLQTFSGTGALHLASLFLSTYLPEDRAKTVHVSDPPYANHVPILAHVGLETSLYPYYSTKSKKLELGKWLEYMQNIPDGSIVLLHACAHNPTGLDPTQSQWKRICATMKAKHHVPFFDSAYQGFASGDVDSDAWAIRHFIDQAFDTVFIAQSYAKNMGLYGERVGCLHVVSPSPSAADRVLGQIKRLQRVENSTPPAYGSRVAATILNDEEIYAQWLRDLRTMSGRIREMRWALRSKLEANGSPGAWEHITRQQGMFCFTGLTERQVRVLRYVYHIYTTTDGRFSISGLNSDNIDYVVDAIQATQSPPKL